MAEEPRLRRRHRSFILPVLIIVVGLLLLLNNFGLIGWGVWGSIWRLWPILLILAGLQAVFGGTALSSIIVGGLTLLLLLAAVFLFLVNTDSRLNDWAAEHLPVATTPLIKQEPTTTTTFTVGPTDYSGVTSRDITVNNSLGRVTLNDTNDNNYFSSSSTTAQGAEPTLDKSLSDGTLSLVFRSNQSINFFGAPSALNHQIDLGMPTLGTALHLTVGTGSAVTNFTGLKLTNLDVEVGTGSSQLTLGQASLPDQARLSVGTGSISLNLPQGTAVDINYTVGVGAIKVGTTTLKRSGEYRSDNYDTAVNRVTLTLNVGTGTITVNN